MHTDDESNQTIISGMGELHLEIYVERMKREYNCECTTGQPKVAYRETSSKQANFSYTHKKQSGGSGQFGKIEGYIEPLDSPSAPAEFENGMIGTNIPPEFIPAIEKGFKEALAKGPLTGAPVMGVRIVLKDGSAHAVDSSEIAFRFAAVGAFKQAMSAGAPQILDPNPNPNPSPNPNPNPNPNPSPNPSPNPNQVGRRSSSRSWPPRSLYRRSTRARPWHSLRSARASSRTWTAPTT